jgi:hypothetical protein
MVFFLKKKKKGAVSMIQSKDVQNALSLERRSPFGLGVLSTHDRSYRQNTTLNVERWTPSRWKEYL